MNNIIKINNLNFKYSEIEVLKDINIEFKSNSFTAILGANGCGKTTLLKNILRLVKIESNKIFIADNDVSKLSRKKIADLISYVPQNENINFHFKVEDFIKLGRFNKKTSEAEDNKIVAKMIGLTNLENLKNKYIEEISGGEYQRCIIARALCQESKIMILDEPISALDPLHQKEIMNLLRTLVEKEEMSIICTLHSLNSALDYCEQSILMKQGQILYDGKTKEVLNEDTLREAYNISASLVSNPYTDNNHFIVNPYED